MVLCLTKIKIQTLETKNQNANHMQSNIGNVNLMRSKYQNSLNSKNHAIEKNKIKPKCTKSNKTKHDPKLRSKFSEQSL